MYVCCVCMCVCECVTAIYLYLQGFTGCSEGQVCEDQDIEGKATIFNILFVQYNG